MSNKNNEEEFLKMTEKPKVLVTGGAGFIGRNLWKELPAETEIVVFDNLSRSPAWHVEELPGNVRIVEGDIRDLSSLVDAARGVGAMVHLAAYGSVVESVEAPEENFEHNVTGTFNALRAAKEAGLRRFVFASTGGALIGEATPPVNEESLPKPISPYGASKLCGEAYAHAFAKAYGLNTLALRFANVYGPYSAHKKGAVTAFMKAILTDTPMTIFGDGSATRDYLHVEDLCRGIALGLDADTPPGEVLHLASGRETSVLELARTIASTAGRPDHPIEFKGARPAEVSKNFALFERAEKTLGFRPRQEFDEGIARTWEWFKERRELVLGTETSDS